MYLSTLRYLTMEIKRTRIICIGLEDSQELYSVVTKKNLTTSFSHFVNDIEQLTNHFYKKYTPY